MRRQLSASAWVLLSAVVVVPFAAPPPTHAQEPVHHRATFVYVSMAPEQKIQVYRLDPADGKLTPVEAVPVEGAPGSLAVDPGAEFLFASLRTSSTLASFRIDPATGKLKRLSTAPLPKGEDAVFVSTDRTGRWLLSVSYAAGKVVVHRIRDDGTIRTPAVQTVTTAKTAHCVVTDPENRFVFVPHVTPNAVYQFRLDAALGRLTDAGKIPGGTAKAGPRHLAFPPKWHRMFRPKLDFAFTSDEQGSSVTAYRFNAAEGLKPVQTLSTLPPDFKGPNTTAEVKVDPGGKFVWVSNRGHDSLAGFAIDAESGKLTALGQTPTEKTPRSFDVSPDGRFLLAAGEGSGKLAVYQVDLDTGKLTRRHTYDVGRSLTWVLVIDDRLRAQFRRARAEREGLELDLAFLKEAATRDARAIAGELKKTEGLRKRQDEELAAIEAKRKERGGPLGFVDRLFTNAPWWVMAPLVLVGLACIAVKVHHWLAAWERK